MEATKGKESMSGQETKRERPVKVCHLITDSGIGGAENMLFELATRLKKDRFQCRVIVMKKPGETAAKLSEAGIPVSSLGLPANIGASYAFRVIPAMARLISDLRRDRPDVLHCWLFQANLAGRMAARLAGVPVNISSLRVVEEGRPVQYPLDRATAFMVGRYTAVAQTVADHYCKKLALPAERIEVIENGVDVDRFACGSGEGLRQELGLPDKARVIGAAGRLHKQKGLDVLVEAMKTIREFCSDAVLLVAGEGPEREPLARQARGLPEGSVRFLGRWQRMADFYSLLDVFVLPSRWEGMPNALLEAMAAGVPVVAARTGGVPEILGAESGAEDAGTMVEAGKPGEIAEAVLSLLQDTSRAGSMREHGRKRAELFSLDRMARRYGSLYERLLEETGQKY